MIIGIDASRAIKQQKTGVEWYAYYVIDNLIKIDSQNQYILYCAAEPDEWLKKLGERKNVKIKRLRWPFKFFWTQGRLSLEMLFNALDVLFIPASAMPIIHPKNTIATIHDIGFTAYPEAYGKWQRFYLNWSTRFAVKHARKIITISEFSKQEIIKYFLTPSTNKISVTHLGYDAEKFVNNVGTRRAAPDVLKKYNITQPYILTVGRLEKKKNINNLIKAFSLLKKMNENSSEALQNNNHTTPNPSSKEGNDGFIGKLVLAGSRGKGWEEAEFLIKKYNLQNEVIEPGYVAEEDLPFLYNGAELFLFPSLYEGFGLPILEAFACGTPVACSDSSSLPEVGGEAALYFKPNDVDAITKAMQAILSDENLRQELIEKGEERVKQFSWQKCTKETFKVF
ncbi:MAG: glycosyltransferase family 1 protein [Patescibacteria group bacterium]